MRKIIKYIKDELDGFYDKSEVDSFCFLIVNHLLGFSKSDMLLKPDAEVSSADAEMAKQIVSRLKKYEPIQYILGTTEFYGLPFIVEQGVLIPRFETEELVDLIVKQHKGKEKLKILDFGAGSGCIAISLKKNLPDAEVWCCDISDIALDITARNVVLNGVEIHIEKFDILSDVSFPTSGFDLVVSNPPYVTFSEQKMMQPNVLNYEPGMALFVPDNDPLLFYRSIVERSRELLLPAGYIYFEINEAYGNEVKELLDINGYSASILRDINGKERMAEAYKKSVSS